MSEKINILYIDDDSENLQIYPEALSDNYIIHTTSDIKGIYKILNDFPIKGALVDVHMPEHSGFDVLKKIKSHPSGENISLFLFTTDETQETKLKGLSEEIADYLYKSMDITEIILRIKNGIARVSPSSKIIALSNLSVNCDSFQVYLDDIEINLTLTEYKLLICLVRSKDLITNVDELKSFVYFQEVVSDNNFRVQLANLRKKVSDWNYSVQSRGRDVRLIEKL